MAPIRVTASNRLNTLIANVGYCSLHLLSSLPNSCSDQLGIDSLNLGDFLDDFGNCLLSGIVIVVDGVANEEDGFDVLQRLQLCKLIP